MYLYFLFSYLTFSMQTVGISRGLLSPCSVSDLKVVFKCRHILQIGNFAIIKFHEYENSQEIPTMPHDVRVRVYGRILFLPHCDPEHRSVAQVKHDAKSSKTQIIYYLSLRYRMH